MTLPAKKIIHEALKMSPRDRAAIAEELISSLDQGHDFGVEVAWQKEVQRRSNEIKDGSVTTMPWETVRKMIKRTTRASD